MNPLAYLRYGLEKERSLKVGAISEAHNPVERELLERELALIDAQISWVEEAVTEEKSA